MAATPESPQATIPSTIAAVARAATMTVPQCQLQQLEHNTATMTAIQATTAAATANMVAATNTMTDIKTTMTGTPKATSTAIAAPTMSKPAAWPQQLQ